MDLVFFIPLTIGLVTGYAIQKADEELSYITGVVCVISLVTSLILAPWELQLLILMIIIISTGKFWFKPTVSNSFKDQVEELQGDPVEQENYPKYRGALYKPQNPEITVKEEQIIGKYRGTPIKSHSYVAKLAKNENPDVKLKYRGVVIDSLKEQFTDNNES
jgi:hypothetical protein